MKNGEGYNDPTAAKAVSRAYKSEKKKLMHIESMRTAGQRECESYKDGCTKMVSGKRQICPLKADFRACYAICSTGEDVEDAYRKLFPEKKEEKRR